MEDSIKISDEKKKYISEVLNPILEKLVTDCLASMPDKPMPFILEWLRAKKSGGIGGGGGNDTDLAKENEELKAKCRRMSALMDNCTKTLESLGQKEEDEESEEEDDADDMVEEIEIRPMKGPRSSVSAEAYGAWNQKKVFDPPVHEKTDEQKARLEGVLSKSFLFSALDAKEMGQVVLAMLETIVEEKDRPVKQGDDGDFLFVIETGILKCYLKKPDADEEICVKTCEAGDTFGELALLYNCPRAASVEAAEKCVLWKLDRETFNAIVKDAAQKKRERYVAFLDKVNLLSQLSNYEKSQIADAFKSESFKDGDKITVENEPGDKFYVLEEGPCMAEKSGEKVMDYSPGDYFGELALLRNQPRAATVKATGDCKVLSLDRKTFKRLLGPLEDVLSKKVYD